MITAFLLHYFSISLVKQARINLKLFLHNIYYQYISLRYFKVLKSPIWRNIAISYHIDDARTSMKAMDARYDLVFLDAFTPSKQPTLWTYEFLKELVSSLDENGLLISYSMSSPFRSSLKELGLCVGKFYDKKNKICSTVASFNPDLIQYKLDEYELGLLNTKAGILYHDSDLNSSAETILEQRQYELVNSKLQSTSSYIKSYGKKRNL